MQNLLLPNYFPLIDKKKQCKTVAKEFFNCFEEKGKQLENIRDSEAGQKGLNQCVKELEAYKQCMQKVGADKNIKLTRTPEAYLEQLQASRKEA